MCAVSVWKSYGFTDAVAEEVELCTSCLAASYGHNVYDVRRMNWEHTFDTFISDYAANGESFIDSTTLAADSGAAEYLNTCFFTFLDPAVNLYGIAYLEIRDLLFKALILY